MIRWIMDNERYNADYLAIPGVQAMQQAGEQSWTNATHPVIADELPTLAGQHLTLRHLTPDGEETPVVLNTDGELVDASTCRQARLFVTQYVTLADGQRVTVKSGLQRLKEAAEKLSLAQYSEQCGVPEAQIIALAETFTSHGRKAAVISHGGMMAGNGFYNARSVMMLNALIGNLSLSGGVFVGGGKFNGVSDGPATT